VLGALAGDFETMANSFFFPGIHPSTTYIQQ
jgi:hypothetical protein